MTRLDVQPADRRGHFMVSTGGAVIIASTRQPLFDGARFLLEHGYPPDELMTTRNVGNDFDNFTSRPVGVFAALAAEEERLRIVKYKPTPWRGKPAGA